MLTLRIALYVILCLAATSARAELFKCPQADGKFLYTDRPCAGAMAAVKGASPAPAAIAPVTAPGALVPPKAPKYARDERKVEEVPTPAQIAAREKYKKAYFAQARAEIKANIAKIEQACNAGDAGACKVIENCAAIGGCELK